MSNHNRINAGQLQYYDSCELNKIVGKEQEPAYFNKELFEKKEDLQPKSNFAKFNAEDDE